MNHSTTSKIAIALSSSPAPEFFPVPQLGVDPYFGLSRSYYYRLEQEGYLKLTRLRVFGRVRGKVLVPYAETAALIRKLGEQSEKEAS